MCVFSLGICINVNENSHFDACWCGTITKRLDDFFSRQRRRYLTLLLFAILNAHCCWVFLGLSFIIIFADSCWAFIFSWGVKRRHSNEMNNFRQEIIHLKSTLTFCSERTCYKLGGIPHSSALLPFLPFCLFFLDFCRPILLYSLEEIGVLLLLLLFSFIRFYWK